MMKPEMLQNIFLIGFMGTGKSTVAWLLAKKLCFSFVDLDAQIEERQGCTISEIFANQGEAAFRDMETEMIDLYAKQSRTVIACGGGIVLRPKNVEMMKRSGIVILLQATPETIQSRLKHNTSRPLLQGRMQPSDLKYLMEKRKVAYEQAGDIWISTDEKLPEEVVSEIVDNIAKWP